MQKIAALINAARLRTLPLSISGVVVGTALANFYENSNNTLLFILALLTTIGFQVTSNFANDYGDGVKGTDNENRIGPKRVLQSGLLTRAELKRAIIVSIIINSLLVIAVVRQAFGLENLGYFLLFMLLGAASIWASIKYTVGESAYGYRGLGDVFVFLFFGLLAVLGSMFLFTKNIVPPAILPAITIGLLSVGVLNLNNLRDHVSDKISGKNTLVVLMGFSNGKKYHTLLLIVGFLSMLTFIILSFKTWKQFIPLIAFVPIFLHLIKVWKTKIPVLLDSELKKLALSTFLMALLFYVCFNIIL
ncbi:1,4-dihydroxy-2-naphthoate octaprenyltransferase [Kriegella aquimaris]|uniref:1,4-dihydroxy-2-naphthoate octaprenyltransferase n=1 Tax=Kriegella aquimaris TaxID=192904 RepID=A0A1G9NKG3_9FLAO|nr:1,4-dihydroxy-2-naphthoate octaprenyltransferase [Kriegella aquimaris]SDL87096.1 1,4-dihydroxy-2-naphthoate prenyltransferase [Kriegella aquimaris]